MLHLVDLVCPFPVNVLMQWYSRIHAIKAYRGIREFIECTLTGSIFKILSRRQTGKDPLE